MSKLVDDLTEVIAKNLKPGVENYVLNTAKAIVDFCEDEEFSLGGNGWLDDAPEDNWISKIIIDNSIMYNSTSSRAIALHVLRSMEENGLSLYGNGWIDDDSEADIAFIVGDTDIIVYRP